MNQPIHIQPWKLVVIGLTAGVLGGGLGLGGGIILVPLLVFAGLERHRAHATSLAAIVLISVSGAISFGVSGEIDMSAGITMGIGGIIGSVIGASVMHRMSPRGLTTVFGFVLLVGGIRMILGGDPITGATEFSTVGQTLIALGIGLIAGFFAGLAGIGGGVVIVPASVLLLGLEQHQAQGTSLAAIIFTAAAGTVVNFRNQRVRLVDGLLAGAGGVGGSLAGSQVALGIDARTLSVAFGLLVIYVALRSLYRTVRPRPV